MASAICADTSDARTADMRKEPCDAARIAGVAECVAQVDARGGEGRHEPERPARRASEDDGGEQEERQHGFESRPVCGRDRDQRRQRTPAS